MCILQSLQGHLCVVQNLTSFLNDLSDVEHLKVNKSVYRANSRHRYHKTLNNIFLHVSNHTLKDVYMLNYGNLKIRTVFCTFVRICPAILG